MPRVRWAILGTGAISSDFATAIRSCDQSQNDIVAVASRKLESAKEFGQKFGIEKCYGAYEEVAQDPDVDVVYIGTINPSHAELSKTMINAGKAVLCEKPMTMNLKQASSVIDLAKEKKTFYMEAFWTNFIPGIRRLKEVLEGSSIGDPRILTANFGVKVIGVDRVKEKSLGGGGLLDLGCYCILMARIVFPDAELERIVASGTLINTGVDSFVSATLYFNKDRVAHLIASTTCLLDNYATIAGSKEKIIKVPNFWCPTEINTPSGSETFELPPSVGGLNFYNSQGLQYEVQAVNESLLRGDVENSIMTHEMSLWVMKVMDEIRRQVGVHYDADND